MKKTRVLFICVHNSARSQMAETFLNDLAGDRVHVESAGLDPSKLNPLVVDVMKEKGFDLSKNRANSVFDFYREGRLYDYVITVCDESAEERCPIFPGILTRLHWPFPDPAKLEGTYEERLDGTRKIRDAIKSRIWDWLTDLNEVDH
jgi:arsenate reductase